LPAMTTAHSLVHGKNWLLTGDAATTWDPLSGQGICKALDSGIRAADAIDRALNGDDLGLNEYGRWSRTGFTDYLSTRSKYYRAEQRWPDSPFWQRRQRAI
jgi:flavin-dependent dehydrogenase